MVNTLADLASIAPDTLRFGKGIGCALFNDQASGYDRARAVGHDALRGLTLTGIGSGVRAAAKGVGKAISKARPPKSVSARIPVGRKGQHLGGFNPKKPTNHPGKIGNREFSGHAFDKMQSQGILPSAIENAIRKSNSVVGKYKGTTAYHDTVQSSGDKAR